MRSNSTGRLTFLMVAGVYLLYLGWQLFSGFRSGEATNPIFLLAAIFFFIVGILIIVSNARQLIQLSKEGTGNSTDAAQNAADAPEEESAADVTAEAELTANAGEAELTDNSQNEAPEEPTVTETSAGTVDDDAAVSDK